MLGKLFRFLVGLVLVTGLLGFSAWILFTNGLSTYYPAVFPYILAFFFLVNAVFFLVFLKINSGKNSTFVRNFMLFFGLKFFLYLIAAVIAVLAYRNEARNVAVTFMVVYVFYAAYEVVWFTSLAKRKK